MDGLIRLILLTVLQISTVLVLSEAVLLIVIDRLASSAFIAQRGMLPSTVATIELEHRPVGLSTSRSTNEQPELADAPKNDGGVCYALGCKWLACNSNHDADLRNTIATVARRTGKLVELSSKHVNQPHLMNEKCTKKA